MGHSVEDRQNRCRESDSRGELLHRLMQRIRLGGDQHEIEWLMQVVGQHGRRGNVEIAVRADNAKPIPGELLRAPPAHQERHITARSRQARAEIAAQSPRTNHQNTHDTSFPMSTNSLKPCAPAQRSHWASIHSAAGRTAPRTPARLASPRTPTIPRDAAAIVPPRGNRDLASVSVDWHEPDQECHSVAERPQWVDLTCSPNPRQRPLFAYSGRVLGCLRTAVTPSTQARDWTLTLICNVDHHVSQGA